MKITKPKSAQNKSRLKEIDQRFLKAIDFVLSKKTDYKIKSERALSLLISNDASTISKIKAGTRGVTIDILKTFGTYFNLDFNFFFRGIIPMDYLLTVVETDQGKSSSYRENFKNSKIENDIQLLKQLIQAGEKEINKVDQIILLISEEAKRIENKKVSNQQLRRLLKEVENTRNVALKKYMELKKVL